MVSQHSPSVGESADAEPEGAYKNEPPSPLPEASHGNKQQDEIVQHGGRYHASNLACAPAPRARPTMNIFGYNLSEFGLGIAFVVVAIMVFLIVVRRL
jgi:hypothetical protein